MPNLVITIGREPGSGGKLIAEELSKLTGFPIYDKELINEASKESGLSEEFIEKMDEKVSHSTVGGLFGLRNSLMDQVFSSNYLSNESLFKIQSDVIRKIAIEKSVIFVGRCADYVLKNSDNVFNVYITAPKEDRIIRMMERNQLDKQKAKELVEKMDKRRRSYYNYYSNKCWGHANSYHLSIDSSKVGIKESAEMIFNIVRGKIQKMNNEQ